MFPIRDHNPSERTPIVTYSLIGINVLVFLFMLPLYAQPLQLQAFFFQWALIPRAITEGVHLYGFLTSMFLHGGFMHLASNMLFLWVFGDNLEDELGHIRYLGFFLLSGLAAGLAQYTAAPESMIPMVGASGAIAGVMGGYLLLFPKARVDVLFIFVIFIRIIPIPAWIVLSVWFALQVFSGVATPADGGGVAFWAHSGGFLGGLAMILPIWVLRGGPKYWRQTLGHPPHPETTYRRTNIPVVRRRR